MKLENCSLDIKCEQLLMGQFYCSDPVIDPYSQQPQNCSKQLLIVKVPCFPVRNICCGGVLHTGVSVGFYRNVSCKWVNGKSFSTALLLSIFFGWLGIDRFYLGYPALGLLKLSTFGLMFIWTLIDIILIALQIVGPSDGSSYIVDYYGPWIQSFESNRETFFQNS